MRQKILQDSKEPPTVEGHTPSSAASQSIEARPGAGRGSIVAALIAYYAGSLIVLLAAVFGFEHLAPDRYVPAEHRDPLLAFSHWDGRHYTSIASEGYDYDPGKRSTVAFFPLYPMMGAALSFITGLRIEVALLIVAHAFLIGCLVLLHRYVVDSRCTHRADDQAPPSQLSALTLIAFSFWPTTFFFRMTYSESLFVFLAILALYGMHRGWPLWSIALVCGLASATRPAGVALLLPFGLHVWNQRLRSRRNFRNLLGGAMLCAVACWGLLAYMLYQQFVFGDALAFAKTQQHWTMGEPSGNKIVSLVTLEPIWSAYVSHSAGYWAKKVPTIEPLFNLHAANPIYFLLAVALVAYGAHRRWLNAHEVLLSAGLILIPYVTRSYEMAMASQARYVASAFPMYIVMGELLRRIPSPWQSLIVAPAAVLMAIYAALFAAGFVMI